MTLVERARILRGYIEKASAGLCDADALEAAELFPVWRSGRGYTAGDRVRRDGLLWRCLTAHTAEDGWAPGAAPSLWDRVLIPEPGVIPAWEQPGSTNGYAAGDRVEHGGKVWESLCDNNVWEPGAVGTEELWVEVTVTEETE